MDVTKKGMSAYSKKPAATSSKITLVRRGKSNSFSAGDKGKLQYYEQYSAKFKRSLNNVQPQRSKQFRQQHHTLCMCEWAFGTSCAAGQQRC